MLISVRISIIITKLKTRDFELIKLSKNEISFIIIKKKIPKKYLSIIVFIFSKF